MPTESAKIEIVRGADDCLDQLKPLWIALHDHHASVAPHKGHPRSHQESWNRRKSEYHNWFKDHRTFTLLAKVKGLLVGYAFVRIVESSSSIWEGYPEYAILETLSILADYRGLGLGSAILNRMNSELASSGITEVSLAVITTNESAIEFYERHGFKPTEVLMRRRIELMGG